MRRAILVLALAGCARQAPPPACPEPVLAVMDDGDLPPTTDDAAAIGALLDDWHQAASVGDGPRYFGYFTPDAVFIGTDLSERWTVDEFQAYASPHFEDGHGWTMTADRREIVVREGYAYFDEDLTSEGLGAVRGSGVLRRTAEGWAIAHYVLSFIIPNERVVELKELLASPAPEPEDAENATEEPEAE